MEKKLKRAKRFLLIEGSVILIATIMVLVVGKLYISPVFAYNETEPNLESFTSIEDLVFLPKDLTEQVANLDALKVSKPIEKVKEVVEEVIEEPVEKKVVEKKPTVANKYAHLYSEHNLYLLAKIIQCEQGYQEPEFFEAKVMVGLVVLNRALSEQFPSTIEGVIFQKNQFQPTFDGSWERKEPTKFDYETAKAAFAGIQMPEHLNDALYFMEPRYSAPKNVAWFRNNLTYVGKSGTHEFYK